MTVEFELDGQKFLALNGGPEFSFSEAISFQVSCRDQDEVDALLEQAVGGWRRRAVRVAEGPVRRVVADRPDRSSRAARSSPDRETSQRVMRAMLQMKKIEIGELERALRPRPADGQSSARRTSSSPSALRWMLSGQTFPAGELSVSSTGASLSSTPTERAPRGQELAVADERGPDRRDQVGRAERLRQVAEGAGRERALDQALGRSARSRSRSGSAARRGSAAHTRSRRPRASGRRGARDPARARARARSPRLRRALPRRRRSRAPRASDAGRAG